MKTRLNANTWVVIVLFTIIGLMGIDIARNMLTSRRPDMDDHPSPESKAPKFKVGEKALDFTLPDKKQRKHTLSELVKSAKNDTILWFTCGCRQCMGTQEYMAKLAKLMGDKAPNEINVTTMNPDRFETWVRDTKLRQTILVEQNAADPNSVAAKYQGKPCPRYFHLKKDMTVAKISDSPAINPDMNIMASGLAMELGFKTQNDGPEGGKKDGQLLAPWPKIESAGGMPVKSTPPTQPGAAAAATAHSEHDGHAH